MFISGTACYTDIKQKEIFDKNLDFVQIKESYKKTILYKHLNKILHELENRRRYFSQSEKDYKLPESTMIVCLKIPNIE